jgi:hypothetical protein
MDHSGCLEGALACSVRGMRVLYRDRNIQTAHRLTRMESSLGEKSRARAPVQSPKMTPGITCAGRREGGQA